MQPRINIASVNPGALNAMLGLANYLHQSGLDTKLLDLINLRVSQINGCAYCMINLCSSVFICGCYSGPSSV